MDPTLLAQLGQAATTLAVTLIITLVTATTGAVLGFIKSKTNDQQLAVLQQLADIVVRGAEQQGTALNTFAVDKKEYAMTALSQALTGLGIRLDPAVLDAAIEAAVLDVFNYDKATAPKTEITIQPAST
jgi:hypothetical protein